MSVLMVGAMGSGERLAMVYERAAKECTCQQLRAFILGQASRLTQIRDVAESAAYVEASERFLDNLLAKKRPARGFRVLS